jgi:hypothetical protein
LAPWGAQEGEKADEIGLHPSALDEVKACMVCGSDGIAVIDAVHRRRGAADAVLQAFDLLELNGEDLRPLPFEKRKAKLARLPARINAGIALNEHTEADAPPFPAGLRDGPGRHRGEALVAIREAQGRSLDGLDEDEVVSPSVGP